MGQWGYRRKQILMNKPRKVRIYLEGGSVGQTGNSARVDKLKLSFHTFFEKILSHPPQVSPKGSGGKAVSKFSGALSDNDVDIVLLLVDSEGPAPEPKGIKFKQYLSGEGQRPKNLRLLDEAEEYQIFLMVQCTETWFIADKEGLASYYRRGGNQFDTSDLPPKGRQKVEDVDRHEIYASINKALAKADEHKRPEKRRRYEKYHAFEIIAYIDPHKVEKASPHFKRLISVLRWIQSGKPWPPSSEDYAAMLG